MLRTELIIDLDAVEYNFNNVRKKLPNGVKLLCVLKADAYGHGAVEIGRFFDNKADFYGVACIEEAMELKHAGIKTPQLILGYTFPDAYPDVVKYDIRIPVFTYECAKALSDEACRQNKVAKFHFCVDTGMSRIGFQVSEESANMCREIVKLPNIEAEGIFSHFATADEPNLEKALLQRDKFDEFILMLKERGVDPPIKHINNSAGIMNFDKYYDMCRMGIVFYGLYPSEDVDKSTLDIKPAMSWSSHVSYVKTLEAGREISYGGIFKTERETVVATVPVGYADSYPRCLSNKGRVLINGEYAPILGRVCMDQFMVDVTNIPNVRVGTEVTLIGKNGDKEISMEEFSAAVYSFNYEIPCRVNRRVPRSYYKDGRLVDLKNYLE